MNIKGSQRIEARNVQEEYDHSGVTSLKRTSFSKRGNTRGVELNEGFSYEQKNMSAVMQDIGFDRFRWTATPANITTYGDIDYFAVIMNYLLINAGETGFTNLYGDVIANNAIAGGMFYDAIVQSLSGAQMKDIVTSQINAFLRVCVMGLLMLAELRNQMVVRSIAHTLAHDDDTAFANSPKTFTNPTFNNVIAELKNRRIAIPSFIVKLARLLTGLYTQRGSAYVVGNTTLPGSYVAWQTSRLTYTLLANSSTSVLSYLLANMGEARVFAAKYGFSMDEFDPSMLTPREVVEDSPDWVALQNHTMIMARDAAANVLCAVGSHVTLDGADMGATTNATTTYTERPIIFHKDKPSSFIHRFAKCMSQDSGANNALGLTQMTTPTAADKVGIMLIAIDDTAWTEGSTTNLWIFGYFWCFWNGASGGQFYGHQFIGFAAALGIASPECNPAICRDGILIDKTGISTGVWDRWSVRLFVSAIAGTIQELGSNAVSSRAKANGN
jgi:hypothetical protein